MGVVLLLLAACLPLGRTARLETDVVAALEPQPRREPQSRTELQSPPKSQWSPPPSSWVEQYEAEAQRRLQKDPLVDFPWQLTIDYQVKQYLGAGSFGESWLVTVADPGSSMYKQQVVVKLLYVDEDVSAPKHLTWRMALEDPWSMKGAKDAARECEIASALHEQGEQAGASGVERIMNCYGHNIPDDRADVTRRLDTPLFLVLQNCGGEDLTKFMHRKAGEGKLSVGLVGGLFKQILEGLDFLASLAVPWLHHDLKPDNIVVKSHGGGSYSAYLIDFGATVKATQAFMCKFTACTRSYAPSEWGTYAGLSCPQLNFDWSSTCPSCGTSFDVYSASAILFEMVIGSRLHQLEGVLKLGGRSLSYSKVDSYAKNPATISTKNVAPGGVDKGKTFKAYLALMQAFLKQGSTSEAFFDATMAGLRMQSSKRPTAAALLQHEFFAPEVSVQEPVQPVLVVPVVQAQGASESTCRYSVGEVIEAYHFAPGHFVQGTVRTISATGFLVTVDIVEKVQVRNAKPGTMAEAKTTYVRPCMSTLFRKIAKKEEEHYLQGGFRPAVGKHMANYDDVSRISTDSSCPALCFQCDVYQSLSPGQFVCWSPTLLMSAAAAQWLSSNNCDTTDTYSKTKFGKPFYGYVCST